MKKLIKKIYLGFLALLGISLIPALGAATMLLNTPSWLNVFGGVAAMLAIIGIACWIPASFIKTLETIND